MVNASIETQEGHESWGVWTILRVLETLHLRATSTPKTWTQWPWQTSAMSVVVRWTNELAVVACWLNFEVESNCHTVNLCLYSFQNVTRCNCLSIYCQIISSQSWTFWLKFVVAFVYFLCHLHNPYYDFTTPAMVTSGQEPSSDIGLKVRKYWLLTFRSDGLGHVLFWMCPKSIWSLKPSLVIWMFSGVSRDAWVSFTN